MQSDFGSTIQWTIDHLQSALCISPRLAMKQYLSLGWVYKDLLAAATLEVGNLVKSTIGVSTGQSIAHSFYSQPPQHQVRASAEYQVQQRKNSCTSTDPSSFCHGPTSFSTNNLKRMEHCQVYVQKLKQDYKGNCHTETTVNTLWSFYLWMGCLLCTAILQPKYSCKHVKNRSLFLVNGDLQCSGPLTTPICALNLTRIGNELVSILGLGL